MLKAHWLYWLKERKYNHEIAFDAKTALEDCSDGWDKIYAVIDNHSAQLLDEKTTKEEE